jgi:hypothetical protein
MKNQTKTETTASTIVGLDLGMGGTKIWTAEGGQVIVSQVAMPTREEINLKALGLGTRKKPMMILNGSGRLFVGDGAHDMGAPIERLDYEKLQGSPEMKALVYAALTRAGIPGAGPATLLVGLPLGVATGPNARANVDAVKDWLMGQHEWQANSKHYSATISNVGCSSQAHAAYVDWLLDIEGRTVNKPANTDEVAIISIGFNTIEMLVMRNHIAVGRFTVGETLGTRRYLELINASRGNLFSLGELDTMLRSGLSDSPALNKWGAQVAGHIETTWGSAAKRFSHVIAVGGGSVLLGNGLVSIFGDRLVDVDEPIMSVARGLYKLGRMQAR